MAEGRKIDFKITILWALLQAFEELLIIFLKYQNRLVFSQRLFTNIWLHCVGVVVSGTSCRQNHIGKVRTIFQSNHCSFKEIQSS